MHRGVEATAYLVNESRARRPDLAGDPLAAAWMPDGERPAVRGLWDKFAEVVYEHDDLVVSLRGRCVADTLGAALRKDPDTILVNCGAGFSSYPWLLPFRAALEVDLPDLVRAKQQRVTELVASGVLPERDVRHAPVDLNDPSARSELISLVNEFADGRPVAYVAEGVVFYLPPEDARAVVGLGAGFDNCVVSAVSYWPAAAAESRVLADQRDWFRSRSVPEEATYLTDDELTSLLGAEFENQGPEDLQRRYLSRVVVPESDLIPEYVAVSWT
ncbi:class I SAM-dependent methyltransferase [Streptomyces sp. NBC_00876]|uniref:class I SAM-dependent methyltransferase n=1 Tax=Streptomyces sp. NBC_00876 TaxID=2975853 RepID=UPI00386F8B96|nr:class I SAM-dependent methyltransferase [Streptomyces sp. NBC_00876]